MTIGLRPQERAGWISTISPNCTAALKSISSERADTVVPPEPRRLGKKVALSIHAGT